MIEALLVAIAVIGVLQLLVALLVIATLRHGTGVTENLHTTVDDIRTDLMVERNRNAGWKG